MTTLFTGRKSRTWLMLALLGSTLAACGGSAAAPVLSTVGRSVDGGQAAPGAPTAQPSPQEGEGGGGQAPGAPVDRAKIVRTGSLSLQARDVGTAVTSAQRAIEAMGGYVSASRQTLEDDHALAQITYRIPSARWEDGLTALRELGEVLDEQTDAVDVTGQLVDLAARIENLRASERSLQAILSSATRVPDVLVVQERLFQVRGEIEQLTAQQAHLEDQASYGTLTVTFGVEVVAITEAARGWDAVDEVERATASLVTVLQTLASAGIWFLIVLVPMLLMVGVLAGIAFLVLRRFGIIRRPPEPTAQTPA
jgi:hypothetical protein